jgi:hypothetical protein
MTVSTPVARPPVAVRRTGYVIAAVINAVMLYLINVSPGWAVLPFLTADTERVLPLVNLALAANVVVNLVYLVYDARWCTALGNLVTAVAGLASAIRVLRVFPFDFSGYAFDWTALVRVVLIVGVAGTGLAVVVQFVTVVRRLAELSTKEYEHGPR